MTTKIKELYDEKAVPALKEKFGYENVMQIPKLDKIVINMRFGDCKDNTKAMESAIKELTTIAGQKPLVVKARKSVSNFKLRKGMDIAAKVTLRSDRMYEFADRLINIAIPRIRDFRGMPASSFDGRGNYAIGLKEQLIFPEIEYDKIEKIRGLDVVFVTTAKTDEEAYELLVQLGMPFVRA
ncbi:MAG: 50S ribosomal protein L5 [Eubacteriaceae bacterium]|nr:50S ribosomal protein L5 [Eubacteriaceae bacterium]